MTTKAVVLILVTLYLIIFVFKYNKLESYAVNELQPILAGLDRGCMVWRVNIKMLSEGGTEVKAKFILWAREPQKLRSRAGVSNSFSPGATSASRLPSKG